MSRGRLVALLSAAVAGIAAVVVAGMILADDEPAESVQGESAEAPDCETNQPAPFRDPGRILALESPAGPRALQAQALELAFAGQGAEIDAWQVRQDGQGIIGLVFAAPGQADEPLSGFVRGFAEQGGDARIAQIAGKPVAIGTLDDEGAAATSSGCYGVFVFTRDEGTIRFIIKRFVVGIGGETR